MITEEQIKQAKQTLSDAGYIVGGIWHIDDIRTAYLAMYDMQMSIDDSLWVRDTIERTFDANVGINWESIGEAIFTTLEGDDEEE